jgi:hypothetical protein
MASESLAMAFPLLLSRPYCVPECRERAQAESGALRRVDQIACAPDGMKQKFYSQVNMECVFFF